MYEEVSVDSMWYSEACVGRQSCPELKQGAGLLHPHSIQSLDVGSLWGRDKIWAKYLPLPRAISEAGLHCDLSGPTVLAPGNE